MSAGLHPVTAIAHVAPATTVVAALVDEQPGAITGVTLANVSRSIAGKQLSCAVKDCKEDPRNPIGCTRPFRFDLFGPPMDAQQRGHLGKSRVQLEQALRRHDLKRRSRKMNHTDGSREPAIARTGGYPSLRPSITFSQLCKCIHQRNLDS